MKKNLYYYLFILFFFTANALESFVPNPIIATIPVGFNPAGSAVTPDSRFVYIANNNNNSVPNGDAINVIEVATQRLFTTIHDASFNEPYTVTINAAGTIAYVTNSNGTTVTRIDITTNTVIGTITGFDGPSGFAILPNGTRAYVNNYGGPSGVGSGNGNTVRVVDLTTNAIIGPPIVLSTTVPAAPAALAVTPNGQYVYVINYVDGNIGTGTISVIRTSDNTVVNTISNIGLSGPFAIAITPDGNFAYIANFGSNNFSPFGKTVSVINLNTNTLFATITIGVQPSGLAITPDGKYVYVSNYYTLYLGAGFTNLTAFQGTVNVIRTCDNQVMPTTLIVGSSPANIVITPNGYYAYVSNYTSDTVSVINLTVEKMWLLNAVNSLNDNCCR